jgi:hypothetical protein
MLPEGETRNTYIILVGKRPLGRSGSIGLFGGKIKTDLNEMDGSGSWCLIDLLDVLNLRVLSRI